jgi:hypothetical protein
MNTFELKAFGFVGFEHIDPKKRDGKQRMVRYGVYADEIIAIVIIAENTSWFLDKISVNRHRDALTKKYFSTEKDITTVLNFIEKLRNGTA